MFSRDQWREHTHWVTVGFKVQFKWTMHDRVKLRNGLWQPRPGAHTVAILPFCLVHGAPSLFHDHNLLSYSVL